MDYSEIYDAIMSRGLARTITMKSTHKKRLKLDRFIYSFESSSKYDCTNLCEICIAHVAK